MTKYIELNMSKGGIIERIEHTEDPDFDYSEWHRDKCVGCTDGTIITKSRINHIVGIYPYFTAITEIGNEDAFVRHMADRATRGLENWISKLEQKIEDSKVKIEEIKQGGFKVVDRTEKTGAKVPRII